MFCSDVWWAAYETRSRRRRFPKKMIDVAAATTYYRGVGVRSLNNSRPSPSPLFTSPPLRPGPARSRDLGTTITVVELTAAGVCVTKSKWGSTAMSEMRRHSNRHCVC